MQKKEVLFRKLIILIISITLLFLLFGINLAYADCDSKWTDSNPWNGDTCYQSSGFDTNQIRNNFPRLFIYNDNDCSSSGGWSSLTSYSKGDVVTYNSQKYWSVHSSNKGNTPKGFDEHWKVCISVSDLASRHDQGEHEDLYDVIYNLANSVQDDIEDEGDWLEAYYAASVPLAQAIVYITNKDANGNTLSSGARANFKTWAVNNLHNLDNFGDVVSDVRMPGATYPIVAWDLLYNYMSSSEKDSADDGIIGYIDDLYYETITDHPSSHCETGKNFIGAVIASGIVFDNTGSSTRQSKADKWLGNDAHNYFVGTLNCANWYFGGGGSITHGMYERNRIHSVAMWPTLIGLSFEDFESTNEVPWIKEWKANLFTFTNFFESTYGGDEKTSQSSRIKSYYPIATYLTNDPNLRWHTETLDKDNDADWVSDWNKDADKLYALSPYIFWDEDAPTTSPTISESSMFSGYQTTEMRSGYDYSSSSNDILIRIHYHPFVFHMRHSPGIFQVYRGSDVLTFASGDRPPPGPEERYCYTPCTISQNGVTVDGTKGNYQSDCYDDGGGWGYNSRKGGCNTPGKINNHYISDAKNCRVLKDNPDVGKRSKDHPEYDYVWVDVTEGYHPDNIDGPG